MGWFGNDRKPLRELLEIEVAKGLNDVKLDVDLGLEDLDVELDELFESLGDTFDSLGETFDSLGGNNEYGGGEYGGSGTGYTGASKREENRAKIRAELASDRERMKADMRATKARMREDKAKMKADMRKMKKNIKQSLPRGTVNIQSGGSNNISVSGNESISISGTNGNLTMKVGTMNENTFKHKLKLTDHKTDTVTHVRYFDENNFSVFNDEFSGSFNANDGTIRNIKRSIRNDMNIHKAHQDHSASILARIRERPRHASRPPPPMPQMPPNETFKEHELYSPYMPIVSEQPNLDVMAPSFDTEGDTFNEYDKPHQSAPPHTCEPLFLSRTWKGEKGKPVEFDEGAKVTVSGHNAFGRKYEVKINGNAIYIPEIENLMDYCYAGDHLDAFMEMRSPAEKAVLSKIIDGLIAMKIAEPHHEGIKELL